MGAAFILGINMMTNASLGPILETERLILRPPVRADFAGFCAFQSDADVMKHLGGVTADSVTWRVMRTVAGAWALDGFHMFSVIEKASGAWIGRVGPLYPHEWPGREVGWGILSAYWRKGYTKEAAIACMDFVFDQLGWDEVIHTIAPDNAASIGVAKSLGSTVLRQANLPDPYSHVFVDVWGQSRGKWAVNRQKFI
jgi:RimJ/RimL family protein N-acetyltransferase